MPLRISALKKKATMGQLQVLYVFEVDPKASLLALGH